MNKQQLLTLAKRQIDAKREQAQNKVEQTLLALRQHDDWRINEKSIRSAMVDVAMCNDDIKATLQTKLDSLLDERKTLLDNYGVTESDLTPHYSCNKCNDTGYVLGQSCDCLKSQMRSILIAQSNVENKTYTFANSTETNEHNVKVYNVAKDACKTGKNILLTGTTGNGKTYLLTSCANYCLSLGKTTMFATASILNKNFLDMHVGDLETKSAIWDSLIDVDVLVIDDLGTENVYKNVTAEYLYSLINDRLTAGKQTFISTNLSLRQLRDRYDERIFSRVIDQKRTFVAQLVGDDKRLQK